MAAKWHAAKVGNLFATVILQYYDHQSNMDQQIAHSFGPHIADHKNNKNKL